MTPLFFRYHLPLSDLGDGACREGDEGKERREGKTGKKSEIGKTNIYIL
jgi:hypothetical protein